MRSLRNQGKEPKSISEQVLQQLPVLLNQAKQLLVTLSLLEGKQSRFVPLTELVQTVLSNRPLKHKIQAFMFLP